MIDAIQKGFANVGSAEELETWYQSYCGKTGEITVAFKGMKSLSPEEKKTQ